MPLTWSDRCCLTASWPGRRRCHPRCRWRGSSGSAAGSCLSSPENKMWLTSDDIWLTLTTPPQVRSLITQQTPNPWAQLPSGSPDWNTSELYLNKIFQSKWNKDRRSPIYVFCQNLLQIQKYSSSWNICSPKKVRSPKNVRYIYPKII